MKTIKHILALCLALCMLTSLVICSGAFTVVAASANLALNKPYTNPAGTHDHFNAHLTDGIASDKVAYDNDSWYVFAESFGNCIDGVGTIIIDLGESKEIGGVRAHLWNYPGGGLYPPTSITVSGSIDGESYGSITSLPINYEGVSDSDTHVIYWTEATAPAGTKARFIKFDFALRLIPVDPFGERERYALAALNELEVYGEWIAHEPLPEWHSAPNTHWRECTCGSIVESSTHDRGFWTLVEAPTADNEGTKERRCSICGYLLETASVSFGHQNLNKSSLAINSFDPNDIASGTSAILTKPYEIDGYEEIVAFQHVTDNVYRVVAISGYDCNEADGEILAIPLDIPENGFVWAIRRANDNDIDAACRIAEQINVGEEYVIEGIDLASETYTEVTISAIHAADDTWHSDSDSHWHECSCGEKSDVASHDDVVWVTTEEAGVCKTGSKELHCTVCDYVLETAVIPATSHDYSESYTTSSEEHWHECSCGEKSDVGFHDDGVWVTIEEAGVCKVGAKELRCTVCGYVLDTEDIPALHSFGSNWKNDKDSHWHECTCGTKSDTASHDDGEWVTTEEAGVCKIGSKELRCTICNYVLDTEEIPATSHNYSESYTTSSIEHWHECSCGEKTDVGSHDDGIWVTTAEAGVCKIGSKDLRCTVCDCVIDTEEIPATSHNYSERYTTNSKEHWHECPCGEKTDVDAHEHGIWVTIKEAGVCKFGVMHLHCAVCNYFIGTEEIPPTSHDYSESYTTNSEEHWHDCPCGERCDAESHDEGEWVITEEASADKAGLKEFRCTVCGYVLDTEEIPATNPNTSNGQPQIIINGNIIINGGVNINNQYNNININSGNAFSGDTTISVNEIKDGDVYNVVSDALSAVSSAFTAYDFTATKDGKEVQPSETFTIDFAIPESFSNDVSVLYVSPDGKTEAVPSTVNEEKRVVTAEISHFSVYVLVDNSAKQTEAPSDYKLGDVNNSGDIDSMDYVLLKRAYFGTFALSEEAKKAADVNGSGDIDSMDYVLVKRAYFGTFQIK